MPSSCSGWPTNGRWRPNAHGWSATPACCIVSRRSSAPGVLLPSNPLPQGGPSFHHSHNATRWSAYPVYARQGVLGECLDDTGNSFGDEIFWRKKRRRVRRSAILLHLAYKGYVRSREPEGTRNDVR